jgi:hypothetical protein
VLANVTTAWAGDVLPGEAWLTELTTEQLRDLIRLDAGSGLG